MGNKAAGGPFQLEVPNGEAPGFHLGAMSGSAREQGGCASADVPANGAGDASDGSGDDERAYASPAEVEDADEEGEMEVAAAPATTTAGENTENTINFTRNNSRNSMGNKRLLGSAAEVAAAADGAVPAPEERILGPVTADGRPAESVLPPPPLTLPAASASASPPRAPGCNDLQLPPLNDPHPLPGSDAPAARGSPNSADGRDQKGAQ